MLKMVSDQSKNLAVIIPVYNEGPFIASNLAEIISVIDKIGISCLYTLIDDGSTDSTWAEIQTLKSKYSNLKAIRFSRNFGKEVAISAGLDHVNADLYLIMDSDLQHPPQYVEEMLKLMEKEQADIVNGVKSGRSKENIFYRYCAKRFYKLLKLLTGLELNDSSDFKLLNRRVVDALRRFAEKSLFFRGLVDWVGFKSVTFHFVVEERANGKSRFSTGRLLRLAQHSTLAYSGKPLYVTIMAGFFFLILSVILAVQTLYNYLSGMALSGFTTVILLILFTGALILISLGIIGVYLSMIYDEIKNRPRYIISESIGLEAGIH
jgi:polyisoprenyl-phosphate glycosyltransferase